MNYRLKKKKKINDEWNGHWLRCQQSTCYKLQVILNDKCLKH